MARNNRTGHRLHTEAETLDEFSKQFHTEVALGQDGMLQNVRD